MKRNLSLLLLSLICSAHALTPVRAQSPLSPLKSCSVTEKTGPHAGQLWRLTLQGHHLRFARYGHRYPDNTLQVRQSYNRAGKLSGLSVTVTGFAGPLLNARAAVNIRGQLLAEQGFRRAGFTTPLKSYLQPAPSSCQAPSSKGPAGVMLGTKAQRQVLD